MSHLVGVKVFRNTRGSTRGLRHIAIHGHQFDRFVGQQCPLQLSVWHARLSLVAEAGPEGNPLSRLLDRLNTRWLRMSSKVASGALAYARAARRRPHFLRTYSRRHGREQDGVHYYNSGSWIDARPTYITLSEEGVEIHEYRSDLTIVIPAKNEAKLIPRLLESLAKQDYRRCRDTKVLVADAHSTDGTPEIVMSFRDRLNVEVIARRDAIRRRNCGAARALIRLHSFSRRRYRARAVITDSPRNGAGRTRGAAMRDHEYPVPGLQRVRQGHVRHKQFLPVSVKAPSPIRHWHVHAG